MSLWFSTVSPSSSGHMAFLPRNFNLVLYLFSLPLSLPCPFPPMPISPTSLFSCQAAGITQMAVAQARMLIWEKDACCEVFIVERKHFVCFYFPHSILAYWNLFFKLWKLPISANCGSVYRFLSQCWMLAAHLQTPSVLLAFVQTALWYLAVRLLFCRLNQVLC